MSIFGVAIILLFSLFGGNDPFLIFLDKHFSVKITTSIGTVECSQNINTKDILFYTNEKKEASLVYEILIENFDCGNYFIRKDFQKTLKSSEYPSAIFSIFNLRENNDNFLCDIKLDIVGKTRFFKNISLNKVNNNQLQGNLTISIRDLELTPRSRFGIKTKDEVELLFKVYYLTPNNFINKM